MPDPKLFFIVDKTYVTPIRLIQFLSLVAVFSLAFRYIRWLRRRAVTCAYLVAPLIGMLAMLGRNSLYVFCVGSLLEPHRRKSSVSTYRGTVGIDTRRGNFRHRHHGIHRMARRIATTRTSRLAALVGAALVSGADRRRRGARANRRRRRRRRAAVESLPARRHRRSPINRRCPTSRPRWRKRKTLRILAVRRGARPRHRARRRLHRADRDDAGKCAQGHRRRHDQPRRLRRTRRQCRRRA